VSQCADADEPDGLFLAQAFNTSRLLAFAERTFFSTPYFYADIRIGETVPVNIALTQGNTSVFRARMSAQSQLVRSGHELWEGPIFLPRAYARAPRKWFTASIGGDTRTYAFSTTADSLDLNPIVPDDSFGQLRDSCFTAQVWHLRHNATHAKSRTLKERNT